MTDSCHSPSVTDGLTFLGSTEAHTSRSPLLLPSFRGTDIYKHPEERCGPTLRMPTRVHLSFHVLSVLFLLTFSSVSLSFLSVEVAFNDDVWE